jgi:hypothetical protein
MIRAALLGAAIAIATAGQTFAQLILGAGRISCGEWLQFRSILNAPPGENLKEKATLFQLHAWIDGFLSGTNVANISGPDFLASKPSGIAMYAWVDNYCRSRPLDHIADAAEALIKELRSRAQ